MASIQGVYVALFGRPADPAGLAYFNGVTNNGANLTAIANLAGQKEYTDRFTGFTSVQIVNSIYQSLFGRDAEAAGLNFFVDALNKGTLNINNIAIAILDGAQGDDKASATNKIAAADAFTKALDTPTEVGNYVGSAGANAGRTFLSTVNKDAASVPNAAAVDAAIAKLDTDVNFGNTVTVATFATDVTVGAVADTQPTTAISSDRNDTINITTPGAVVAAVAGKINGGFGVDTVVITTQGGNATGIAVGAATTVTGTPAWTSIEKISITAKGGAADAAGGVGGNGSVSLNVGSVTGLTEITNDASTDGAVGGANAGGAGNVTLTDVALATKITLKGAITGDTSVTFKDAGGTADSAALNLSGAGVTGTVTINSIETLNISNSGTSSVSLTADAAKTLNVSGSGTLTLGANAVAETISASGYTGALTANLSGLTTVKSYVGSTGADKVTVDVAQANDITINTGAGSDTLILTAGGAATNKAITLTGGAGADIFEIGGGANVANVANVDSAADIIKSLVTISDFAKAEDAIKVNFLGGVAEVRDTLLDAELIQINATANLKAAADLAATYTSLNSFSIFNFGGDAYIFNNVGGATFGIGDTLVKITGASAADFTASNLQLIA